jgi:hypothetical protein
MAHSAIVGVLLLAGCGRDGYFFGPPPGPAPEPDVSFERVAVIGASVSAGMGGGPIHQIVDARLEGEHRVVGLADVWTFQAPVAKLREQVDAAVAFEPTAVLGIDALFWCAYGGGGRESRLRRCLEILEAIEAPLFVGDLPDMRNAAGWMLPPAAIPGAAELASLNQIIAVWAEVRANVRIVGLAAWNRPLLEGDPELAGLMSPDGLHPNRRGVAYILRRLAREVDGAGALAGI